ncbi:SCO1/SenC family protein [alpha proteobacterium Q-1]|uniref:SCO family protein n=1 Tax=Iodidimonas nitroreducens TaxID=1236968 RepID=I4DD89_9PROT|nr:hypothetical protein [Iodidimonas nitroreducens]GAK33403.1 SCO1/SenC family protein [alpha proteobacterium Q-1]
MSTTRRQLLSGAAQCGPNESLTPTSVHQLDLNVRCGFPDVRAVSHTGEPVRFYEDRMQNKIFMVNFFSIDDDKMHSQTAHIAKIVEGLGDKVGRDVFITSITVDPINDTVERLAEHAREFNAPDGWMFMRAAGEEPAMLAQRMYHFNRGASVGMGRLVFYGNATGNARIWGTFPAKITTQDAVHRISWMLPSKKPAAPQLAGPSLPGKSAYAWNHRATL